MRSLEVCPRGCGNLEEKHRNRPPGGVGKDFPAGGPCGLSLREAGALPGDNGIRYSRWRAHWGLNLSHLGCPGSLVGQELSVQSGSMSLLRPCHEERCVPHIDDWSSDCCRWEPDSNMLRVLF